MKNRAPAPPFSNKYTPAEVNEILKGAKALGVVSIKLAGFEASWEVQDAPGDAPKHLSGPPNRTNGRAEHCEDCGAEKIEGHYGKPYCRECYLRNKEQRWQRSKQW